MRASSVRATSSSRQSCWFAAFQLLGSEPDPDDSLRRRRFILLGDNATFADLHRRLLLGDVLVPARAFALAQRSLKRVLYEEGRPRTSPAEAHE